ncbi:DNA repair protein RadA [Herpetosiphon sp. NSE202]|uniref:DNA repair protein RadA n=1 Tax=Herpetosiphon sp. NSE202 TaxID=3351349 RepID=UPI0036369320
MAKQRTIFVCQQCDAQFPRWMGRCTECGAWDSLVEQIVTKSAGTTGGSTRSPIGVSEPLRLPDIQLGDVQRLPVRGSEFARVLGGGIVPGSLVLIGGDPGIGKSTLLLEQSAALAEMAGDVLYISAEESQQQIKLRATRLGLAAERLYILAETSLDTAIATIERMKPVLVIVDSIQTVYSEDVTSAAGSVSQVREGALRLQRVAKQHNISIMLVGHVTKEGAIAGPRVLEHIVDVVLYLEGERFHQYRLLRSVKNRFGSTNEVGVFEMNQGGMVEVTNPSQIFLAERSTNSPGSAVAVMLEGTRPLLLEVQALTSHTANAQPRRTANGFDQNRLAMIIAVLSKRVGVPLFNQDIYVNVVGGLKVTEPAIDLAVATAITSSFRNQRVEPNTVLIGEIGLSGELRSVSQLDRRLNEAAKLGFHNAIVPQIDALPQIDAFQVTGIRSLVEAVRAALIGAPRPSPGEPPTAKAATDHDD